MSISFPTFEQIKNRIRSDVNQSTGLDATVRRSLLRSMADSLASRAFDVYKTFQQALNQLFPQTATNNYLRKFGDYEGLPPFTANVSAGSITVTGVATTNIPATTELTSGDVVLISQGSATISEIINSVATITRVGTTATATTTGEHSLATSIVATVSGADQAEYNGSFPVTVISSTEFSYQITGSPATPATGTIAVTFTGAVVSVDSQGFGADQNLESGAIATISVPIAGVDDDGYAGVEGIAGGTDDETSEDYRVRILSKRANPTALFNEGQIINTAKETPGVTRVFVKKATPAAGQTEIYFLRDEDESIAPDAGEIAIVTDSLLEILPAHVDEADLFVLAPTLEETDFTFASIIPDSEEMRTAITANLGAFFTEEVEFEKQVSVDAYRAAIITTIDETGQKLDSFTLTVPPSDINVGNAAIATLGIVTYI